MNATETTECDYCRYSSGHTSWCPNNKPRRVNLNTATDKTRREVVGRATTVDTEGGKRQGLVERIENGRAIVRFLDGTWAYSRTNITVR